MGEAGDVAKAIARIKEELRSSAGEARGQDREGWRPPPENTADATKEEMRSSTPSPPAAASTGGNRGGCPPPGGEGARVERRSDDTLTNEERLLRKSFARLVVLQHRLKEKCRFTRASMRTVGVCPVGIWLSAVAWSQFMDKRLEGTYDNMQSELQARLVEYLLDGGGGESGGRGISGGYTNAKHAEVDDVVKGSGYVEVGGAIDFEDLSPELQREFQLVQARATEELGPLALEPTIQMQCMVQAESYPERLDLLRECVDNERSPSPSLGQKKELVHVYEASYASKFLTLI
jgi:hypothetical protein